MTVALRPKKSIHRVYRALVGNRLSPDELPPRLSLFRMALIPTDWGTAGILWRENETPNTPFSHAPTAGLLSRVLTPGLPPEDIRRQLAPPNGDATEVFLSTPRRCRADQVPTWTGPLVELLQATFSDTIHVAHFPNSEENWPAWEPYLDFAGMSDFQIRVLGIVGRIPRGATLTYGEVARRAGNPNGARAVGMVMRKNPWPILVPCHRVVGASGQMTGFSAPGGVKTKQWLLAREIAQLP